MRRTESAIGLGRILRTIDSRSSPSVGGVDGSVWVLYPLAFGLSGSLTLNFVVSLMYASRNKRRYSDLSIMTTPDLKSGFVMTISSRRFNLWMALRSDFADLGPLRWV